MLHSLTAVGGIERIVIKKANWLANHGFEVVMAIAAPNKQSAFFDIDDRIKRIYLNIRREDTAAGNILTKTIKRYKYKKEFHDKLEDLLHIEKPDIAISPLEMEIGLPDMNDGSKKVSEMHFSRWCRIKEGRPGIYRLIDIIATRNKTRQVRKYDVLVSLTNEDREDWGTDVNNIRVIPNFIEPVDKLSPLQNKQVVAVGRLAHQKGFDRLIRAWMLVHAIHPEWILKIYGSGSLKQQLEDMIQAGMLDGTVSICEPVRNIEDIYAQSSMIASSSVWEGLPMVLLEAMSCGLPVVTFDYKCGPKDLIDNGENGLIVAEGDIEGLADSIVKLIENPQLRNSMGQKAYQTALRYSEDKVMPQWVSLFNELCRNKTERTECV